MTEGQFMSEGQFTRRQAQFIVGTVERLSQLDYICTTKDLLVTLFGAHPTYDGKLRSDPAVRRS